MKSSLICSDFATSAFSSASLKAISGGKESSIFFIIRMAVLLWQNIIF